MRVVFDTNIFLRALISPYGINALLLRKTPHFEILLSKEILEEILEVLYRSSLRKKYPQISEVKLKEVLRILEEAKIVTPKERVKVSADPKDDKFLEAALGGGADYIVSADSHLLEIKNFKGIRILTTNQFLKLFP